jgi:hypothetical protein
MSIDPRIDHAQGLFVVPKSNLSGYDSCFDSIYIAHSFDDYVDTWYDAIDMDEEMHSYYFTPSVAEGNLYVTVETYSYDIIPYECKGNWASDLYNVPVNNIKLYADDKLIYEDTYEDTFANPILIQEENYDAG